MKLKATGQDVATPRAIRTYQRIETDLTRRISAGEWMAGDPLPGRRELARQYGCDLKTLQRAVAPLLLAGTLRADAKRGTYVGEHLRSASRMKPAAELYRRPTSVAPIHSPILTLNLAVIAPIFDDEFHDQDWNLRILHGAERTWGALGGTEVLAVSRFVSKTQQAPLLQAIESARELGCNAAIIVHSEPSDERNALLTSPVCDGLHYAFIGSQPVPGSAPNIYYDGHEAGYQAAEHLIRRGYRRLMVFSPFRCDWMDDRSAGVLDAVRESGISIDISQPLPVTSLDAVDIDQLAISYNEALRFTAEDLGGVGVIAANDHAAIGLLRAATEKGIAAGRDYGLVGCDDTAEARANRLTTLRPPLESMGEEGARLLMRSLMGDRSILQVRLRSHLIPRESSRLAQSPGVQAHRDAQ